MAENVLVPSAWPSPNLGVDLQVCQPPYRAFDALSLTERHAGPRVGSVVCGTGRSTLAVLEYLALAIEKWPWVAPCAGLPPSEYLAQQYAALQRPFDIRLAVVHVPAGRRISAPDVVKAVIARPTPGAANLVAWICQRLQLPDLATPLLEQLTRAFDPESELPRSAASYSRLFSSRGKFKAHDWQALARLIRRHSLAQQRARPFLNPRDISSSTQTLRTATKHARKYLAMSLRAATALVGWEWVLERALRVAGYVGAPRSRS